MKVRAKVKIETNNAKLAPWLGFLRAAKKVTLQSLAETHGTQRSNISAFVTSGGKTKNISVDKIKNVLFQLGILADGTLTPGLHRWNIKSEMIPEMCDLLTQNEFERGMVFELGSGYGVFVVAQVTTNILVFANLPADSTDAVTAGMGSWMNRVSVITLDRAGDSYIQSLWMTADDLVVESGLLSLIK